MLFFASYSCTCLYCDYLCYFLLNLNIYVILSLPFCNISVILSHTYIPLNLNIYGISSLSFIKKYIPSNRISSNKNNNNHRDIDKDIICDYSLP